MTKISFDIPDTDERGVSPVIGVILMVAITVILAAVIASFVLGFGDSVSENVQAGADITEKDDGTASVTWISEGNAVELNVSVAGSDDAEIAGEVGDTVSIVYDQSATVAADDGEITLNGAEGDSQTVTVTVTAVGSGDSRTVISQEEVTLEDQNA